MKKNGEIEQENEKVVVEGNKVFILHPGMSLYVKTPDMCSSLGVSNQWVGQLTAQGTINKARTKYGGLYELIGNTANYCSSIKSNAVSEEDMKMEKAKQSAETMLKASKAKIAKMEADELDGKMHRTEDIEALEGELVYALRGALLALPGRLAVDVVSCGSPAEAADIIRREVYKIMNDLRNFEFDSKKYDNRVRERMDWGSRESDPDAE